MNSNCGGCCKDCVSLSLVGFMVPGWLSAIGVLSWFCVESKAFELLVAQGDQFYTWLKEAEGFLSCLFGQSDCQ